MLLLAKKVLTVALAAGIISAAAVTHAQQPMERCYGVARAGANGGVGDREAPGTSTVDYQGDAWTEVPQGSCQTMPLPAQPDGTPRRGALEPLDRDRS
jgi:uncharacterized membrane protein